MRTKPQSDREIISLRNVTLYREERLVLQDVNLSIRSGEHWVLLGPNGGGKSSLMGVLQGWLWPLEGEVRVLGRTFGESDLSELRRFIGWVGSEIEPELPARQTVEQIVLSGRVGTIGIQFDKPNVAARVEARRLMRRAGILHLAQRPFAALSQGQRRMVVIVRALMVRPGLLILDEPAAGLDPVARENFLAKLSDLMAKPGSPVIFYVTHHVEEIIPAFTHVLLLRAGRILSQGTLRKCLNASGLTRLFGCPVRIAKRQGRYFLRLAGATG